MGDLTPFATGFSHTRFCLFGAVAGLHVRLTAVRRSNRAVGLPASLSVSCLWGVAPIGRGPAFHPAPVPCSIGNKAPGAAVLRRLPPTGRALNNERALLTTSLVAKSRYGPRLTVTRAVPRQQRALLGDGDACVIRGNPGVLFLFNTSPTAPAAPMAAVLAAGIKRPARVIRPRITQHTHTLSLSPLLSLSFCLVPNSAPWATLSPRRSCASC